MYHDTTRLSQVGVGVQTNKILLALLATLFLYRQYHNGGTARDCDAYQ